QVSEHVAKLPHETLRFGDVFARQHAIAGLDRRTEWINRPIDDRSRVDLADQLAQREPPGRHLYCDRDLREDGMELVPRRVGNRKQDVDLIARRRHLDYE